MLEPVHQESRCAHLECKLNHRIYGLKQSPRCWNIIQDEKDGVCTN